MIVWLVAGVLAVVGVVAAVIACARANEASELPVVEQKRDSWFPEQQARKKEARK